MAPVLGGAALAVGASPALKARLGGVAVWQPPAGVVLPEIGAAFEGGYYAGLIDVNAAGIGTHALIVAPASGGQTTGRRFRFGDANVPITASYFDGAYNTAALIANDPVAFDAANFCAGLTFGGFTDWYMPAIKELEVAYYNLKPRNVGNATGTSAGNRTENNIYAVPRRNANYTYSNPPQTSVLAFREGYSQAFLNAFFWSSTLIAYNVGTARQKTFNNGSWQDYTDLNQSNFYAVRAFRRVAL